MKKDLVVAPSEQALAQLRQDYPVEAAFNRILLPRLGMVSQDVMEGKGKNMKVVTEAGTFFIEKQTDEEDEDGKKIWAREELGSSIEGIILFKRKQLRLYDEKTEQYTSSPIYDNDEEVIPLFCDKVEVAKGTPKELKAKYEYTADDGKKKSKLEENRILYVLKDGEIYQMNLRGTSMYAFMTYERKTLVPSVLTSFSSEAKEKGTIAWNCMTFKAERPLNAKEVDEVIAKVAEIKEGVMAEKKFYASKAVESEEKDKELDDF